jgi:SAM-dependent methyltransferase
MTAPAATKKPIDLFWERTRTVPPEQRPAQWSSRASIEQYRLPFEKTAAYLKQGERVLDWGAGNGHFSSFLLWNQCDVTAYSYEPQPAFLEKVSAFAHRPGNTGDPVSLPFSDDEFDAVFSMGVLEHVHEFGGHQKGSVAELHRVLKAGGLFYCFHLPNRFSLVEGVVRLLNRVAGAGLHAHSKRFSRAEFESLLSGTRFKIIESGRYNVLPRNQLSRLPGFLSRSRPGVALINFLDNALAAIAPALCQNWFFILRKE